MIKLMVKLVLHNFGLVTRVGSYSGDSTVSRLLTITTTPQTTPRMMFRKNPPTVAANPITMKITVTVIYNKTEKGNFSSK